MAKQITVSLGGKDYVVKQLPIRKAKAWRERLKQPFSTLSSALNSADKIELTNGSDLAGLINSLSDSVIDAPDMMFELLCLYCADIAADRDVVSDNAYDDEVQTAFVEVLKLAYPFGKLMGLIRSGPTKT